MKNYLQKKEVLLNIVNLNYNKNAVSKNEDGFK